ncbi:MAG: hypothetical protein QOJ09_1212 [Actinomycetota bacterium]|nr:hypothetical protein [Actinomycetota bacterium]
MSLKQRIVISLLLAAAVVGIVVAFQMAQEPKDKVVQRDSRVAAVFPKDGDIILRQDTVYAEIVLPYTGVLRVDGLEIDAPQLKIIQVGTANRLSYTPGPATITGYLHAGIHRATVIFWKPDDGRKKASEYSWSFSVK